MTRLHGIIRDVRSYTAQPYHRPCREQRSGSGLMKNITFYDKIIMMVMTFLLYNSYFLCTKSLFFLRKCTIFLMIYIISLSLFIYTLSIKSSSPFFLGTYTVNISNVSRSSLSGIYIGGRVVDPYPGVLVGYGSGF